MTSHGSPPPMPHSLPRSSPCAAQSCALHIATTKIQVAVRLGHSAGACPNASAGGFTLPTHLLLTSSSPSQNRSPSWGPGSLPPLTGPPGSNGRGHQLASLHRVAAQAMP
eukprot:363058-Chlamydomonas_euryale.AAC.3